MLGRAVEGVKLERRVAGVPDIVPRAGGHDHPAAVLDVIAIVVDVDLTPALLETEELVAVLMDLRPDVAAGRQAHQHQLEMVAGVEHPAEIRGLGRLALDVVVIALHALSPASAIVRLNGRNAPWFNRKVSINVIGE